MAELTINVPEDLLQDYFESLQAGDPDSEFSEEFFEAILEGVFTALEKWKPPAFLEEKAPDQKIGEGGVIDPEADKVQKEVIEKEKKNDSLDDPVAKMIEQTVRESGHGPLAATIKKADAVKDKLPSDDEVTNLINKTISGSRFNGT